ncbi:glyoxylase I family protein [Paenibacillus algorifonticola]|uniref:Glyoxylase I family protein n=1 Tax=Paenibacillus algorifonticola TaxID=684063 RepID=A0A1I1YIH9_9BACL|nr:VOC family protein [Paenibacillus algorifonticola]SFE19395.1 glyoxylase I family protein [Paenibacillus algorifonticola]
MNKNAKIGGGGIHHIALRAYDFEATVKFYTEGLGFTPRHSWGEGDGRVIMLDSGDGNYLEVFAGGKAPVADEGSYFHLAYRSENIELAVQSAVAAGAVVTVETKEVVLGDNPPTPVKIAFVKGLNGEIIEFFQSTGDNQL